MIFKCKNCGGNVVYNPDKKKMACPFCDSEDSQEREYYHMQGGIPDGYGEQGGEWDAQGVQSAGNMQNPQNGAWGQAASMAPAAMSCPNCGGRVDLKPHTSATQCPYCDSFIILDDRVEGKYTPKYMIPFKFGKEICKNAIKDHFKKAFFAPIDFLSEVRLNTMQGIYVPFWFYNYDINYDMEAEGIKVRSWTSGDRRYTERSIYQVIRNVDIDFRNIPADASIEMPDNVMDLMAPYDYAQFQPFSPEYLSGFYAEKYNMESNLIENRAKEKMRTTTERIVNNSCSGYSSVNKVRSNIGARREWAENGLLPVWKYVYKYKDKEYPFYVNGQTGKIVGNAPISSGRVWAYAGTLCACLIAVMGLLNAIFYLI